MSEQLDLRDTEIAQLRRELEIAQSQAIQAKAQAVTVAAERDELRRELKAARDELAVYRLASETAMYEAGQFDAGLFQSGDRGVEDVMRRVLRELERAQMKASQAAEGYEIERQARILAVQQRDAERERCALVAESCDDGGENHQYNNACTDIAKAIRGA